MKCAHVLRTLAAACSLAAAAHASATPILLVDRGVLVGATGVDVGGTLYNVKFTDGSCSSLFNGCKQSEFTFNTRSDAQLAARALLNQVFVNGPGGQFDAQPDTISGCTDTKVCMAFVPYLARDIGFDVASASNYFGNLRDSVPFTSYLMDSDSRPAAAYTFAVFQLAPLPADVPEPTSIALFGLALGGLAFNLRRKV